MISWVSLLATADHLLPSSHPIWVSTASGSYPIWTGYHLLAEKSFLQPYLAGKQVFILSHPEIAAHYLSCLKQTCLAAGAEQIDELLIPSGDAHKVLSSVEQIWTAMLSRHHYRDTTIIALGGGMIGDLAGFAAACYMRGVAFIQYPTTLLAQIDAAVGGKTAINYPHGKNMIGAFHHPRLIISDLATLNTLPKREFIAGIAELIKYGVALDSDFFDWIKSHIDDILCFKPEAISFAVRKACQLKAEIISLDEKDQGPRVVLNFGHTVAHALEALLDYSALLHGEAVAIGMVVALHLSFLRGSIDKSMLDDIVNLLNSLKLPTKLPSTITTVEILTKIKHDKKHFRNQLRWVLLDTIGKASICEEITDQQITQALLMCGAKP